MDIISKTHSGTVGYCERCRMYQVEFGNLLFRFSENGFEHFRNYVVSIDGERWEYKNRHMSATRKIFLRLPVENIYFCICAAELDELKRLVLLQAPREREADEAEALMRAFCMN